MKSETATVPQKVHPTRRVNPLCLFFLLLSPVVPNPWKKDSARGSKVFVGQYLLEALSGILGKIKAQKTASNTSITYRNQMMNL